jgi:Domain of unknown function (DUF4845)
MKNATLKQQAGVSFGGFIMGLFLFSFLAVFSFKLIPAYMENGKIQNIFIMIAHDPAMQAASVSEIRTSFDKRADIDNINSLTGADIEITKEVGGRPLLNASNEVKIKLVGNMTLLLSFNPTSAGK